MGSLTMEAHFFYANDAPWISGNFGQSKEQGSHQRAREQTMWPLDERVTSFCYKVGGLLSRGIALFTHMGVGN